VAGDGDRRNEHPDAPGWYPDPWSATGEGERYFDGTHWGTTEKPMGRHTVAVKEVPLDPPRPERRRGILAVVVLVVAVAAVWGVPKLLSSDSGGGARRATGTTARSNDAPPPSQEESARPLGTPAPVPDGTGRFEVLQHQRGDASKPVAWDPCRPVHYVVNPSGGPADGPALIHAAIAQVGAATGLQFVDDGTTSEAPSKERGAYQPGRYGKSRWAPVLVAWSDEGSYPELAGYVAGLGDPQAVYAPNGELVYVTGQLVLDDQTLSAAQTPDRTRARAVILHELGHIAGLDHTNDRNQLMFSEAQFNVTTYGDGDLRGLALLGRQSCFPGV
jgi:hypothetical protein